MRSHKFRITWIVALVIVSFAAGYFANVDRDQGNRDAEPKSEQRIAVLQNSVRGLEERLAQAEESAKSAAAANEERTREVAEWRDQAERLEEELARHIEFASIVTDGRRIEYDSIPSDRMLETIVFVHDVPDDYTERGRWLMKLGVEFAGHDAASFWYDERQARQYAQGRLERNADEMLPPYPGMFGELTGGGAGAEGEQRSRLLLHGSTGGPLSVSFGRYATP